MKEVFLDTCLSIPCCILEWFHGYSSELVLRRNIINLFYFVFILYLLCSYLLWICECKVTTKIYYIYTRDSLHLSSTNYPIGCTNTSVLMSQCIPVPFCLMTVLLLVSNNISSTNDSTVTVLCSSSTVLSLFCLI